MLSAMDTSKLLTAQQVAALWGKSRSQIARDAAGDAPKLPATFTFPGYRGGRLFAREDVVAAYGLELTAATVTA